MQITKNFSKSELDCNCGCGALPDSGEELLAIHSLQDLRDEVGPMIVNCGHRCESHNKSVGGAENSRHLKIAFDISLNSKCFKEDDEVSKEKVRDFVNTARGKGFKGIGFYNSFIHIDTGFSDKPFNRQWDYSDKWSELYDEIKDH